MQLGQFLAETKKTTVPLKRKKRRWHLCFPNPWTHFQTSGQMSGFSPTSQAVLLPSSKIRCPRTSRAGCPPLTARNIEIVASKWVEPPQIKGIILNGGSKFCATVIGASPLLAPDSPLLWATPPLIGRVLLKLYPMVSR